MCALASCGTEMPGYRVPEDGQKKYFPGPRFSLIFFFKLIIVMDR